MQLSLMLPFQSMSVDVIFLCNSGNCFPVVVAHSHVNPDILESGMVNSQQTIFKEVKTALWHWIYLLSLCIVSFLVMLSLPSGSATNNGKFHIWRILLYSTKMTNCVFTCTHSRYQEVKQLNGICFVANYISHFIFYDFLKV